MVKKLCVFNSRAMTTKEINRNSRVRHAEKRTKCAKKWIWHNFPMACIDILLPQMKLCRQWPRHVLPQADETSQQWACYDIPPLMWKNRIPGNLMFAWALTSSGLMAYAVFRNPNRHNGIWESVPFSCTLNTCMSNKSFTCLPASASLHTCHTCNIRVHQFSILARKFFITAQVLLLPSRRAWSFRCSRARLLTKRLRFAATKLKGLSWVMHNGSTEPVSWSSWIGVNRYWCTW